MAAWNSTAKRPAKPTTAGVDSLPGPALTPSFATSVSSSTACIRLQQATLAIAPGELALVNDMLLAGTADGKLALDEVQMEGKARMPGAQFAKDFQLRHGERLV